MTAPLMHHPPRRDDLLTTENKRQERVQLDAKVAAQLKQLELDVGLLTHQVCGRAVRRVQM